MADKQDLSNSFLAPLWTEAAVPVVVNSSVVRSAKLSLGAHVLRTSSACHVRQGTVAVNATTNDSILGIGEAINLVVTDQTTNGYVATTRNAADGTLTITLLTSSLP